MGSLCSKESNTKKPKGEEEKKTPDNAKKDTTDTPTATPSKPNTNTTSNHNHHDTQQDAEAKEAAAPASSATNEKSDVVNEHNEVHNTNANKDNHKRHAADTEEEKETAVAAPVAAVTSTNDANDHTHHQKNENSEVATKEAEAHNKEAAAEATATTTKDDLCKSKDVTEDPTAVATTTTTTNNNANAENNTATTTTTTTSTDNKRRIKVTAITPAPNTTTTTTTNEKNARAAASHGEGKRAKAAATPAPPASESPSEPATSPSEPAQHVLRSSSKTDRSVKSDAKTAEEKEKERQRRAAGLKTANVSSSALKGREKAEDGEERQPSNSKAPEEAEKQRQPPATAAPPPPAEKPNSTTSETPRAVVKTPPKVAEEKERRPPALASARTKRTHEHHREERRRKSDTKVPDEKEENEKEKEKRLSASAGATADTKESTHKHKHEHRKKGGAHEDKEDNEEEKEGKKRKKSDTKAPHQKEKRASASASASAEPTTEAPLAAGAAAAPQEPAHEPKREGEETKEGPRARSQVEGGGVVPLQQSRGITDDVVVIDETSERSATFAGIDFIPFAFADSTPTSSPNKYAQRQKKFWPHTQAYIASLEKPAQLKLNPALYEQLLKFMKPAKGAGADAAGNSHGVIVTHDGPPALETGGASLPMHMLDVIDERFLHRVTDPQSLIVLDRNDRPSHLFLERKRGIERLVFSRIRAQYEERHRLDDLPPEMQQRLEAFDRYYTDLTRRTRDHWAVYQPNIEALLTNSVLLTKEKATIDVAKPQAWEFVGGLRWADVARMGGYLWALAGILNHKNFPYDMVMVIELAPAKEGEEAAKAAAAPLPPPVLVVYAADSTGHFTAASFQKEGRARYERDVAAYDARALDYAEDLATAESRSARSSEPHSVTAEQMRAGSQDTRHKTEAFAKANMPNLSNYIYLHLQKENA